MNDLKRIAETLGYDVHGTHKFPSIICGSGLIIPYNPETNPAQLIELEDWLMDKRWQLERDEYNRYCWRSYRTVLVHESRAQAAIAAALEEMRDE